MSQTKAQLIDNLVQALSFTGTSSAPANGVYLSATNQLSFATNTTERLRIDSAGQLEAVSLGSASAPTYSWTTDPDTGVYSPGANQVAISTNGTPRLFVDASGNVGINKVALSQAFHVLSASGGTTARFENSSTGNFIDFFETGGGTRMGYIGHVTSTGMFVHNDKNGPIVFDTNNTERMRLDSSGGFQFKGAGTAGVTQAVSFNGSAPVNSLVIDSSGNVSSNTNTFFIDRANSRVGLGTSSPSWLLQVAGNAAVIQENSFLGVDATTSPRLGIVKKSGASPVFAAGSATAITFSHSSASDITGVSSNTYTPRLTIDSSGRVGIGTTSPSSYATGYNDLVVGNHTGNHGITIASQNTATGRIEFADGTGATEVDVGEILYNHANNSLSISTNRSTALTVDSSQRLLVGTSSALTGTDTQYSRMVVTGNTSGASAAIMSLSRPEAATSITTDEVLGLISFADNGAGEYARITCAADANAGSGDYPGRLVFSTTADGASSPTERMRIDRDGNLHIAKTTGSLNTVGYTFYSAGLAEFVRSGGTVLNINRLASDGGLVDFYQDSALEGNISVSGSTVFFNGAHLARWSQLANGAQRVDILRGSVLSNLDEMCEWGEEANEQLNRMKISDVDEDPNVAGVFISWDDDDDTYTDDFYCAMTGDFIIRIAEGVTVQRGDLLMSAGDGTAKPQDDDIIRSKTVAKVTSTHVTCTYDDGSYCVPCVLMAC
jgi:hypothetical protein